MARGRPPRLRSPGVGDAGTLALTPPVRSVLHVTQPVEGGVGRCVLDLARDQLERGLSVTVACPPGGWLSERLPKLGAASVDWRALRSPGPGLLSELRRLRRIVAGADPDVVHLHSSKAGLVGRLLRRERAVIFQPHAWSFQAVPGLLARAAAAWERHAAGRTDLIVCVSEDERKLGVRAGIRARYAVVPNGVDLATFSPASDQDRTSVRRELGLPDVPTVVCVGRLSPQKGQDILLRAWPVVRERVPEAALYLVGADDGRGRFERDTPGATLVGHRDDVAPWLAASDVVAAPSRWEAMSLAVLEAMARGRSVVASDAGGNREVLGTAAGVVVPAGDPLPLADAIVARLRNPELCQAEGRAGAERARAHDVRRTTAEIFGLYEVVAGGPA